MINKKILFILFTMSLSVQVFGQEEMPLYSGKIPNSKTTANLDKVDPRNGLDTFISETSVPTLRIYLPTAGTETGTAVIICPGGGYSGVAVVKEGYKVAEEFQKMGVAAFVLKYRMPSDETMLDKTIGPIQDAQRAIQMVKSNAKMWKIDTASVGIIGFSAGGHLAAFIGTHFQHDYIQNKERISLRPAFMVLGYPVISFTDSLTHMGSRNNLIGKNPSAEKIKEYSNELNVTTATPPAFIVQAGDDGAVKVENSIAFYQALHKNGVEAELLLYPKGGHGFGLNNATTTSKWINECHKWMLSNGWLKKTGG
ncbi:acetyl esterase/lipase [Pedobacter sp. UYEF25]